MVEQEKKNNPMFDFNRGIPLMGPGIKLKMNSTYPITSGNTQYGDWFLWSANVDNVTVFEGRKPNEKKIENYTGEAIFFATAKMNKELLDKIGAEENAVINVKKEAEETSKGLIKRYIVSKVGGSAVPSDSGLLPSEKKLVDDASGLIKSGYELSENDFIQASKDTDLYGVIKEDRVKELFKFIGK